MFLENPAKQCQSNEFAPSGSVKTFSATVFTGGKAPNNRLELGLRH